MRLTLTRLTFALAGLASLCSPAMAQRVPEDAEPASSYEVQALRRDLLSFLVISSWPEDGTEPPGSVTQKGLAIYAAGFVNGLSAATVCRAKDITISGSDRASTVARALTVLPKSEDHDDAIPVVVRALKTAYPCTDLPKKTD